MPHQDHGRSSTESPSELEKGHLHPLTLDEQLHLVNSPAQMTEAEMQQRAREEQEEPALTPLTALFQRLEARRPKLLVEFVAEAIGTGCYVWAGIGATAAFFTTQAQRQSGLGDLFTIGWSYALGIIFGIMIAGPVSGGHLSPAFTLAFAAFKGFSWKKVPMYILAQLLGAFLASLIVYEQYRSSLNLLVEAVSMKGGDEALFNPLGPAGVLAFFPNPVSTLGVLFWNEFVATTFLSLVVFAVLDQSNQFVTIVFAPVFSAFGYAVCIWSFAPASISLNTARDLGGRMAAACLWGPKAFTINSSYTAIAALTNLIGTFLGAIIHALFIADSKRPIVNAHHHAAQKQH
ncbi:aquaporin-like protein [Meredithblackwellia eburnea MCA 4105]